jgi:DNA polymerase-1
METLKNTHRTAYIIDGNSYIYRAYYAVRDLRTSSGLPTNAVFGFCTMLFKIIQEKKPEFLAIAFDPKGPTRRHGEYNAYKAHRPPMPRDLVPQIQYIHELVKAFRIPVFLVEGQEADDVIASFAHRAKNDGMNVMVVSGDKDLLQLVDDRVQVYDSMKDILYGPTEVEARFGVPPARVVEIMGLMGDAVDNIPGVPGVGEKTAQALIKQYGTIENVLSQTASITKPKLRKSLEESATEARLSRELARLHTDVPLTFSYDDLALTPPDNAVLIELLKKLEFTSLLKLVSNTETEQEKADYRCVLTEADLRDMIAVLHAAPEFSFDTETTSLDPLSAELVGISFCVEPRIAYYIPFCHDCGGAPKQLDRDHTLSLLKPLFEDPSKNKVGQNIKYDVHVLNRYGVSVSGTLFDTMIASYLLNPGKTSHGLDAIALEYLGYKTITYGEVAGTGKKQVCFSQVAVETATRYSAEDADIALRLKLKLSPQLDQQNLKDLFHDLEMPLMEVLAEMERAGVLIDRVFLKEMSLQLATDITAIERSIYELADGEFNINSTKQLADILFNKLGLTPVKKTKTGFSTNVDVLDELAHLHPLPAEILKYRTLAKLKSTYVDALPLLINPETGRLHTSFNQAVAATGRLSSSDPNLQNIPIRTDVGRKIRRAFIADPGSSLLSADYSQIELRVLAHLSADPALIDTFRKDDDIHSRTASEVFGLPENEITAEMRRKAKAVNFGIIYGISAFSLAQDIGVSHGEAKRYIEGYFARYPRVQEFISRTIDEAKTRGYVTTLLGRRRFIPELSSSSAPVRNFGERTAVNTPIQGTAADLIKLAMLHIRERIHKESLKSIMILQVHDELLFETPDTEIERMKTLVKEEMEGVLKLEVPVKVDIGVGKNWDEAH